MEVIVPYIIQQEENKKIEMKEARFLQIQFLIQEKKRALLKKKEELYKIQKENKYLKNVYNDYHNYYDTILQFKREQLLQMEKLQTYINQIRQMTNDTEQNILDAQQEHSKISKEIAIIRKKLTNPALQPQPLQSTISNV